jgi:hypothetical protein
MALAGLGDFALTAGGELHPALRTSAARNERPCSSMANEGHGGKVYPHGESAGFLCAGATPFRLASREPGAPDSHEANPIPFCSHRNR